MYMFGMSDNIPRLNVEYKMIITTDWNGFMSLCQKSVGGKFEC